MIFIIILACLLSLAVGFLLGDRKGNFIMTKSERKHRAEIEKIKEEFKNFLEYDGSEQL